MQTQGFSAKKSFKIDDLAKELNVKKFVIKNWEKLFELKKTGQDNKYSQEDLKVFATIKNLVIIQKMPYSLAKKNLSDALNGKEFNNPATEEFAQTVQESNQEQDLTSKSALALTPELNLEPATDITCETTCEPVCELACEPEIKAEEVSLQESSIQESSIQESVIEQWILDQITAAQVSSEINCAQKECQTQSSEEMHIEEAISIIDNVTKDSTFQGAHESMQQEDADSSAANLSKELEETIMQEVLTQEAGSQETTQEAQTQEALCVESVTEQMLPEESINQENSEEILAAKTVGEITEITPALKEKEEFIRTIQSFKEQLLKIHEQLK